MKITVLNDYPIYPPRYGGQFRIYNLYRYISIYHPVDYISFDNGILFPEYCSLGKNFNAIKVPKSRIQTETELLGYKLFPQSAINDIVALLFSHADPTFKVELRNSVKESDILITTHPYLYPCIENEKKIKIYDSHNVEYSLKKSIFDSYLDSSILTSLVYEVEKRASEDSDLIFAASDANKIELSKTYRVPVEKIHVIPNGVDTKAIMPCNEEEKQEAKKRLGIEANDIILFIGSAHLPNREAAIKVLELAKKCKSKEFFIVGNVGKLLESMDIPKNVNLLCEVDEETKLSLYKTVDIALNPMLSGSGTNIKMLDYLAAGIPTISTPIGAQGLDIVDGEHAIVVNVDDFGDRITDLFNNEKLCLKLRNNGRKLVEAKYDWEVIAHKMLEILENKLAPFGR